MARKTAIGASWMVAWRMVTRVLGLGSTLILARVLVPADFGLVAMASTFAAAVEALSQLGLQEALIRRTQAGRDLFDTAFTLQAARAVATALIVALGAPAAAWWFSEPRLIPVLLVLAGASAFAGFENIGIVEFRRAMRFDVQFRLMAVPRLLQVAATITGALLLRSYWALLIGIVVGKAARLAMTYAIHPYRPSLRLAGWRELAGFSFWTWATSAASLVWDRCDPFVLGPVVGTARLGTYMLAGEMALLPVTELLAPAADVLFAGFAAAQGGGRNSARTALLVASTILLAIMPLIITISCASGGIVAFLLGPKWTAAAPLIALMAWQCVFAPFSWISSLYLVAHGHVRRNFAGNLVVSAVKLAALLVLVSFTSDLAIIAGATALIVGVESATYVALLPGLGVADMRPAALSVLRTLLSGAAAIAVLMALGLAWRSGVTPSLSSFLDMISTGAASVGVFAVVDLALWRLSGASAGPETRLVEIAARRLAPLRARWLPTRS